MFLTIPSSNDPYFPLNILTIEVPFKDEDAMAYICRICNTTSINDTRKSRELYAKILGNANEYKQGDETVGVAAPSEECRIIARQLLQNTKIQDIIASSYCSDQLFDLCQEVDARSAKVIETWTLGDLKQFILTESEDKIHQILPGLTSDVIGCVVKLMSNADLVTLGSKIFNPLPGSKLGAKGYFGARIQPNSPTDDPEDIFWQCLNAFSFAVGDVMLGTNPVSSDPESVYQVERILKEIVTTFGLTDILPFCVLAHVDVQAVVEKKYPNSTSLWFQSIAGSDTANQTFDLPISKMLEHASSRNGKFGLYLETGQGADFTNGHAKGVDMIMHDSRKYGFARALRKRVGDAQVKNGNGEYAPRIYINDVAGFIGPEVFRSKEQLVRVCLEDIAMGKLHGLTIGLDVCSTLHMDISLDDLDWCLDQILPANPSWAMALPTKNDPMLSYLTTSFQDHVRIRDKFGYKVDDDMWNFFSKQLNVVDEITGKPTKHFGDPAWVFLKFSRFKGDQRADEAILKEAHQRIANVQARGVPIAIKYGTKPWNLNDELDKKIRDLYEDAKFTLWNEFPQEFIDSIPNRIQLCTTSKNREDYVFHPETGERLSENSIKIVEGLRGGNLAIVISDGLCADALMDHGHLLPFLDGLHKFLVLNPSLIIPKSPLIVLSGRVRAGYHIGEILFGSNPLDENRLLDSPCSIIHIIGERPGSGHHTFSAYITVATKRNWSIAKTVDHDITRVVSGIADTSYNPVKAAQETSNILSQLINSVKRMDPPPVSPLVNNSFSRPQKILKVVDE